MKTLLIVAAALLLVYASAHAECTNNGCSYPTGTVIGPLQCMPDGTWKP